MVLAAEAVTVIFAKASSTKFSYTKLGRVYTWQFNSGSYIQLVLASVSCLP